jgi:hypothetical protein
MLIRLLEKVGRITISFRNVNMLEMAFIVMILNMLRFQTQKFISKKSVLIV